MQVRYPDIDREIREVISEVTAKRTKISKEKTKKGKALYSPGDMNQQFKKAFEDRGYRELRHSYRLTIPNSDFTLPGTFKQIDFVKGKVLVEVQLGKYFAMFCDMAKFQCFYNENKAEVGVEIVHAGGAAAWYVPAGQPEVPIPFGGNQERLFARVQLGKEGGDLAGLALPEL